MTDIPPFLPGFITAYAVLLVGASSPGPSVALLVGVATAQGRAPALVASAGIAVGSVCLNLLTLAGVGLLLSEAAWMLHFLRLLGGAYLAWLSYSAFRKAVHPPVVTMTEVAPRSLGRHFLAGYLVQVTNPKSIAFWLAIGAIGATVGGGAWVIAAFVTGAFVISFFCHGAWALVLSSSPVRRAYNGARRRVEAALGMLFAFFAFRLAAERG